MTETTHRPTTDTKQSTTAPARSPREQRPASADRRDFLKSCAALAGAAFVGGLSGCRHFSSGSSGDRVRYGHTDLYVSRLCQGTAFREMGPKGRSKENELGRRVLEHAIDIGVNFFDTAEAYGWGGAEELLGVAVKGKRDRIVISTKIPETDGPDTPRMPFTRERLFKHCEGSLRRLGTDSIDIYSLHGPDDVTPPEEIVESMSALVKSGKIRYWGVSNHPPASIAAMIAKSREPGFAPLASLQDYYNIAAGDRGIFAEKELFPLIRHGNLGIMAFSPLSEGRLMRPIEPGNPMEKVRDALDAVARDIGATRAQVCIAWALSRPEITTVLAGAEKVEHVTDNFGGTKIALPVVAQQQLDLASAEYARAVFDRGDAR